MIEIRLRFLNKGASHILSEDGLKELDVLEAITNSKQIEKTLNSTNPITGKKENLDIIKGFTYDNILVYTKGKVDRNQFYILISSKRSL